MITEHTLSGAEGRELFFRFAGAGEPTGIVVIVHGFGEHSGRYLETMERFANHGLSAYVMDLRGFGRNAKLIGDMEDLSLVAEDIHLLTLLAVKENPEKPVVLLGHSMGGLLALNQLVLRQEEYDLAITTGPALLPPENANGFVIAVAKLLSRVAPRLALSPLEDGTATRDPEMIARDDEDELFYHGGFRARTGYQLMQIQLMLKERLREITLPILCLHGGGDLIMNPKATEILFESVGSRDKEKHIFPGLYHEVLNEPERDQVFDVIFAWLDQRLSGIQKPAS